MTTILCSRPRPNLIRLEDATPLDRAQGYRTTILILDLDGEPELDDPKQHRMEWMDALRGVAIILVLVWHAAAVPALLGYTAPAWLLAVNNALLPFRMPTLMVLSGLLVERSMKKPMKEYYRGKFQRLIWPYAVWESIHILLYGIPAPIWMPWSWAAASYLWFLLFIAIYYLVAPLLRGAPDWLIPLSCAVLSVLLPYIMRLTDHPTYAPLANRFLYFAIFFFAGRLLSRREALIRTVLRRSVAVPCLIIGVAYGLTSMAMAQDLLYRGELAPLSLCGVIGAMYVFQKLDSAGHLPRYLMTVGRHSLVYYVSHFPIMLIVTRALINLAWSTALGVACVCFLLAIGAGVWLSNRSGQVPISWLFSAPNWRFPRRARARATT